MKLTPTLTALAMALLLPLAASAQHSEHQGVPKVDYDPEPGGGDPNAPPGCSGVNARITVNSASTFVGGNVTINAGEPVCWTWNDTGIQHNIKADDGSFTSGPPATTGNFQRTFNTPGTYGYHCQVHGSPGAGMRGTVVVLDTGTGGEGCGGGKGALQIDPSSYNVDENGAVSVQIARSGGSAGAASVRVSTVPGSAKAGRDYLPRNNVLINWGDGDCTPKTFDVQTKNDTAIEPDETFNIKLTKATGASLGSPITATVTIKDDDGCSAALAPASVKAIGQSATEIRVSWSDAPATAASMHLERRQDGGAFREVAALPVGTGAFVDAGLPRGTAFQYRLRVDSADGSASYSAIAAAATDGVGGECGGGPSALCLADGRFEAFVKWRPADGASWRGAARARRDDAPRSGAFAFEPAGDLQLLLNVVDRCASAGRYGVELATLSDRELTVTVRDTQTGRTWVYFHAAGTAPSPVRDAEAFTCP